MTRTQIAILVASFAFGFALMECAKRVHAHIPDSQGCEETMMAVDLNTKAILHEGISEDGRDYTVVVAIDLLNAPNAKVRYHFMLLPKIQWAVTDKAAYLAPPLTYYVDRAHDGLYEDMYIDPYHHAKCEDVIHFRWDETEHQYLHVRHKEPTSETTTVPQP